MDNRRRMLIGDSGDNRFYVFKEGTGFMNGFTSYVSGGSASASGISLTGTDSGNRAGTTLISKGAFVVGDLVNYTTLCFEVASTNGTFNVGYWTYRYKNIPLYGKYQRFSDTARTIIKFPAYTLSQLKSAYTVATSLSGSESVHIGIFHTMSGSDYSDNKFSSATGQGVCYNIWLE